MSYQALYRILRPQRFADIVGQEHVRQVLQQAVQSDQLAHAYLLSGPHGTGKTTMARIVAKAVNCEALVGGEPCLTCSPCSRIAKGNSIDVLEFDAASHRGVEEMRDLREKVRYAATEVRYKVYIIDEVHMLTQEAFNALLKTLEEPPSHSLFLLATTEPYRLPATVLSRCQRFSFRPVCSILMRDYLMDICQKQGVRVEEGALELLVQDAGGSMRDAVGLLDQVLACGDRELSEHWVRQLTGGVAEGNLLPLWQSWMSSHRVSVLRHLRSLWGEGCESYRVAEGLLRIARKVLSSRLGSDGVWGVEESPLCEEPNDSTSFDVDVILMRTEKLLHSLVELKNSPFPQIALEVLLLSTCQSMVGENCRGSFFAEGDKDGVSFSDSNQGGFPPGGTEAKEHFDSLVQRFQKLREHCNHLTERVQRLEGFRVPLSVGQQGVLPFFPQAGSPSFSDRSPTLRVDWLEGADSPRLREIEGRWPEVLDRVRREDVRLHAWLSSGSPVAVTSDTLVVSFASEIHCNMVSRAKTCRWLEKILSDFLSGEYRLQPVLSSLWKGWMAGRTIDTSQEGAKGTQGERVKVAWERAVSLFGSWMVSWHEEG